MSDLTNAPLVDVTFQLRGEAATTGVSVVGQFNDWNPDANPMQLGDDGTFSTVVALVAGRSYRYRYLLDGDRWENDWNADSYAPNEFGGDDSVINVETAPLEDVIASEVRAHNNLSSPDVAGTAEQLIAPTTSTTEPGATKS